MKKENWMLIVFAFFLVILAIVNNKVIFHDSPEYISIAKNFAGIHNVDLFSTHSLLYPLMISPFLKLWPSLIMLKLINCVWVFLIGLVFLLWLKDKRAFIIFAFSPLVWRVSLEITPILPASFFFFLAYLFLKKEEIKYNFLYSGFFLGLSYAVYDPMIFVAAVFMLIYFWDKKFIAVITYLMFVLLGVMPRLILDYYLFHMPLYSIIRFFGTNTIISLGLYPGTTNIQLLSSFANQWMALLIVIAISPFLYKLHKLNFKENYREILFLTIAGLLLLVRCAMLKYFLLIAPIAIILLSKVISDKEIKWHALLSMIIIVALSWGFIFVNEERQIAKDLIQINADYQNLSYIVAGPYEAIELGSLYWGEKPYMAWYEDFMASKENRTALRGYRFAFDSKIKLRDTLVFSANFERNDNKTYKNYVIASIANLSNVSGFSQQKCYAVLCIYKYS
jgi:hypothetical protein